jgi:hypothetical protein
MEIREMPNTNSKRQLLPVALIAAIAITAGCNDESTSTESSATPTTPVAAAPMSSYGGPGSNWAYDLFEDGTFEVTRSPAMGLADDLTVNGSYEVTAAGFLQMTVATSSGIDAPAVGELLWAIEVPDQVLLLSPASSSDDYMIPMVQGGQCADGDFGGNWINVRARLSGDATSSVGDYFGSINYTISDGATSLSTSFTLGDGFASQEASSLGNGFCRDGVINTADSDIYVSANGGAIANAFASDEDGGFFVLAMPKKTLSSIAAFDGNYVGVASDDGTSTEQKVRPVSVVCNSGICSGDYVTDVTTGAAAGQPFTVDLFGTINEPLHGFATGQVDTGEATGNIACMVDDDVLGTGQRMISCAGQSPSRNYRLFNLILTSAD